MSVFFFNSDFLNCDPTFLRVTSFSPIGRPTNMFSCWFSRDLEVEKCFLKTWWVGKWFFKNSTVPWNSQKLTCKCSPLVQCIQPLQFLKKSNIYVHIQNKNWTTTPYSGKIWYFWPVNRQPKTYLQVGYMYIFHLCKCYFNPRQKKNYTQHFPLTFSWR